MERKNQFIEEETFDTYEILTQSFKMFCEQNYYPFVTLSSSPNRIVYACCHGIQRKSHSRGKRPNQQYNYKGCSARINLCKNKKHNKWKVTKSILNHNHPIGSEEYKRIRRNTKPKEEAVVTDYILGNTKYSAVAELLENESVGGVSRNIAGSKMFSQSTEENEELLRDFLNKFEAEGGKLNMTYCNDGTVNTMFFASNSMITEFKKSSPLLIQIDISSEFNLENYKVLSFRYYSLNAAKSEFASIAFVSVASVSNLKECINEFKTMCNNYDPPTVFLVDKDFGDASAIRIIFPSANVLFCKFHVIKYMKNVISTACCDGDKKESILHSFTKMMYSETTDKYCENKNSFLGKISAVEICLQNEKVPLVDYFIKNWDVCKEMWVHCYRKYFPFMDDTTTRRVEKSCWTLKNHIKAQLWSMPSISLCIVEIINFIMSRFENSNSDMTQKAIVSDLVMEVENDEDEDENDFKEFLRNDKKYQMPLSKTEKFDMAFDRMKNMIDILSHQSTSTFINYLNELKIVKNNIRTGKSIFNSQNPLNDQ